MTTAELDIFMRRHDIDALRCEHPPVRTVEESSRLVPRLPGAKTKNLLLRDKKGARHYLVVVPAERMIDLVALAGELGVNSLGFASAERLQRLLGIEPGAVSLLALANDIAGSVELVVDRELWDAAAIQAHPLINSATLVLTHTDLEHFLAATGHTPRVVDVPTAPPSPKHHDSCQT